MAVLGTMCIGMVVCSHKLSFLFHNSLPSIEHTYVLLFLYIVLCTAIPVISLLVSFCNENGYINQSTCMYMLELELGTYHLNAYMSQRRSDIEDTL